MLLAEEMIEQARVCSDADPRNACGLLKEACRQLEQARRELNLPKSPDQPSCPSRK